MPRYLIIIACFVIVLTMGFALILPRYKEVSAIREMVRVSQQELNYQRTYSTKLKKASKDLAEYSGSLQKIDSAIPSQFNLLNIYYYFQKAAAQNGLSLQNISPASITPSERASTKEARFSLSLLGSYSSLKNFLSQLYYSSRFIEVESIAFSSPAKGESFDFNIAVKMYSY